MTQNKNFNPYEYTYKPGTKVEIDGELLQQLINFANNVVRENTDVFFTWRFKHINRETQKTVKNPKKEDLESGKVAEIVDIETTMQSKAKEYVKPIAMEAVHTNLLLQNVHLKAIEEGVATHYKELQEEAEKQKPNLILES